MDKTYLQSCLHLVANLTIALCWCRNLKKLYLSYSLHDSALKKILIYLNLINLSTRVFVSLKLVSASREGKLWHSFCPLFTHFSHSYVAMLYFGHLLCLKMFRLIWFTGKNYPWLLSINDFYQITIIIILAVLTVFIRLQFSQILITFAKTNLSRIFL